MTVDEMFDIANRDLRDADAVVVQFVNKAYVIDVEDLQKAKRMENGVPDDGTCKFKGFELTEDLFTEGRLEDCGEYKWYSYKNWELVKVSKCRQRQRKDR